MQCMPMSVFYVLLIRSKRQQRPWRSRQDICLICLSPIKTVFLFEGLEKLTYLFLQCQQNLVNVFSVHDFMPPFINHRGGLACSERQCRGPRLYYGNACESQTHTPQRCLWLRYMRFAAGTLQEKMKASERICLIFRCFCIGSCVPWSCHASSCLYAHRDHFDTERQPDDDRNLLLRCQLGGVVAQGAAVEFGRRDGGIQSQCFVQQTRKTTHTIITYNYFTTINLNKFIDLAFLCHFLQGRISPAW